jgi:predicted heme/steroid binding protein
MIKFLSLQIGFKNLENLKAYTHGQLALRNGQDREEIWCAYRGLIYDLTPSRLWFGGKHYEHWAGQDLTSELLQAPHNDRVLRRFEVVGKLIS